MSSDPLCTGTRTREAYQDIVLGCNYLLEYLVNSGQWTGTDLHEKVSKFVMAAYQDIHTYKIWLCFPARDISFNETV